MQDSLCGSMSMGVSGAPRSPKSSCSSDDFMNKPRSPIHQSSSISNLNNCVEEPADPQSDLPKYSSSSPNGDNDMVATPESPENSNNISSWFSDMLDELTEPDASPMFFSPPHGSTSPISLTPLYSSLADDLGEAKQELNGAPLLPHTSSNSLIEDGMELPNDSQFYHQVLHGSQLALPLLDADYRQPALQYHHHHYHHQQQQPYDHHLQKKQATYHLLQSTSSRAQMHMQASSNGSDFHPSQPLNTMHKAVSAPQLSKLDTTRSPRGLSFAPNSLPLTNNTSPQSNVLQRRSPLLNQSDNSRFFAKNSILAGSRSNSLKSYPDSPSSLPSSLPSVGYLSYRKSYPRSPIMQPLHQQVGQASSHRNTSITPSTFGATRNASLHDSMAPLQQSSNNMMVHFSELQQDSGLYLVNLLLACAEAVAKDNYLGAEEILLHLKQVVSTEGNSMQRVAAYFTDALHARLTGNGIRSYITLRSIEPTTADEVLAAYQILYQACPYVKFAHFTSNQAIFEAFERENRVHIVDLDIVQGYQWPAFIQALAARPGGAPRLRITGVGMPYESVQETGKRLSELAASLRVPFEFHPVGERLENLKSHMLQRRIGEALAINSINRLHRLLSEPVSPLFGVLHMIREQAPNIFTLVEQEGSHNGPFFLGRFLEALHHYSAIFDSLDATLPQKSPERLKVEQLVFSNEITNIVACEGRERIERHEKLQKWRQIMEGLGYENVPLSANAVNQSKLLLGLYPCDGYTLVEDRGGLLLGWQERPIIAASAWRC